MKEEKGDALGTLEELARKIGLLSDSLIQISDVMEAFNEDEQTVKRSKMKTVSIDEAIKMVKKDI